MYYKVISIPKLSISVIKQDWQVFHPLEMLPPMPNNHQLPNYLPSKWVLTAKTYSNDPYDPKKSGTRTNFIRCTTNPIPNLLPSKTTSCVRADLISNEKIILKTCEGPKGLCYAHGNYVDLQMLDADHLQSSSMIVKRQMALIDAMNKDQIFGKQIYDLFKNTGFFMFTTKASVVTYSPTKLFNQHFPSSTIITEMNKDSKFAKKVLKDNSMKKFIVSSKTNPKKQYIGTRLFYKVFHNDINNLWLICKKCNGGNAKHNQDPITWFKNNPLFGKRFLRSISPIDTSGVLLKTKKGKGLALAAKEWFWKKHLKKIIRDRLTNSIFYKLIDYSTDIDKKENGHTNKRQRISLRAEHRAYQNRTLLIQEIIDAQDLFEPVTFKLDNKQFVFDETDQKKALHSFIASGKEAFLSRQESIVHVYENWSRFVSKIIT